MAFITHYRGHLRDYQGPFDELLLFQQVTPEEYLSFQYPPFLVERFPEQTAADRAIEQGDLHAAISPGDTLWFWRQVDGAGRTDGSASEWGGLAVRRSGKVVRVWLVWTEV